MLKISNLIILLVIVAPMIIIGREFYFISLISIAIFLYVTFKYKVQISAKIRFKLFSIVSIVYFVYMMILTAYINKEYMLFSFNKGMTLMFFIATLIYFSNYKVDILKIKTNIIYAIIFISIASIILYIFNIDGIELGKGIKMTTGYDNIELFGERRINWLFEHKLQFASTCLIGVFFTVEHSEFGLRKKILFNIFLILSIYLSNSMMSLLGVFSIYAFKILQIILKNSKEKNKGKLIFIRYLKVCFLVFGAIIALFVMIKILLYIGERREISTLGSRTIIWQLAINDIKTNPEGIIKSYGILLNGGDSIYTTAHNIILNEFLETGIIGGILYISLIIIAFIMIRKIENKYIFFIIMLLAQFDYVISGLFSYVFWLMVAILIVDNKMESKNTLKVLIT